MGRRLEERVGQALAGRGVDQHPGPLQDPGQPVGRELIDEPGHFEVRDRAVGLRRARLVPSPIERPTHRHEGDIREIAWPSRQEPFRPLAAIPPPDTKQTVGRVALTTVAGTSTGVGRNLGSPQEPVFLPRHRDQGRGPRSRGTASGAQPDSPGSYRRRAGRATKGGGVGLRTTIRSPSSRQAIGSRKVDQVGARSGRTFIAR